MREEGSCGQTFEMIAAQCYGKRSLRRILPQVGVNHAHSRRAPTLEAPQLQEAPPRVPRDRVSHAVMLVHSSQATSPVLQLSLTLTPREFALLLASRGGSVVGVTQVTKTLLKGQQASFRRHE